VGAADAAADLIFGRRKVATTGQLRLTAEDVQAAMAYAADLARERMVPLPTGAT